MRSFVHATFFTIGITILFFVFPFQIYAATLNVLPDSGSYAVGKTFPVNIYVSSPTTSINAISGSLSFSSDKLQIVSLSKTSSILTLWVTDPSFSNYAGTIDFEGVVPNPGFIGSSGRVITVNFKVIATGNAEVKWKAGSVLANDGNGTNVLQDSSPASFTLGGVSSLPVETSKISVPQIQTTGGIKISSPTYPDSSKWYTETNGKFTWNVPDGIGAVRMLVGKLANGIPSVVYEPPIDSKQISDSSDGIWYFSLQGRTGTTWGAISRYLFRVDSTPPENFTMKAVASDDPTEPKPKFIFSATDSISGIDHYTVEIDGGGAVNWEDNASGVYSPKALPPGKHTILAKAYDGAGNSTPASIDFTIVGIETPKITFYTDSVSANKPLIIKGTALPNVTVRVKLSKGASIGSLFSNVSADTSPYTQTVDSDDNGSWSMSVDTTKFESGAYDMTATAIDSRGAQSNPTATKTILINSSWWQSIGSSIIRFLAIAIPILALLYGLIIVFLHGFHRVRKTNTKLLREVNDIERLVDRAFILLKEDVEDSVKLLEKTKSRRQLTQEEDAIVKRLRSNLSEAERMIHKQVRQVEDDIE